MKLVSLASGGIDSAVSTALALQKHEVVALHFSAKPYCFRGESAAEKQLQHLSSRFNKSIEMHVLPHRTFLEEANRKCDRKYCCVLCRRMMLKAAEKIAERCKAKALVSGESLGQVASQTLDNIAAEDCAVRIPVIRPLLSMDKLEIEALAKKLGTFNLSVVGGSCCSLPKKPSTRAKIGKIVEEESKLGLESLLGRLLEEEHTKKIEPPDYREKNFCAAQEDLNNRKPIV